MVSRFLLFDSFVRNRFEYSQFFLCGMGVLYGGKRGWLDGDVFAMPPIKHIIPSMYNRFLSRKYRRFRKDESNEIPSGYSATPNYELIKCLVEVTIKMCSQHFQRMLSADF